ncbi:AAA family ATPase [Xanthomarina gelatinilytica]|uniref:AAA family ATPase n=1 Tax=Xanthomarina gelatinilytica TaxID=1137281 RepID=UPI003AA9D112
MSIQKIHDELFDLLFEYYQMNPEFRFRPRKTNRSNKLEEGYWFLGNDEYLAVGFWTGDDWRTTLPTISFMVNDEGQAWLQFSSTDTDVKFNFIIDKIFPVFNLEKKEKEFRSKGGRYSLKFTNNEIKESLLEFLTTYYPKLDLIIREYNDSDNIGINIIEKHTFLKDIEKISAYKANFENKLLKHYKMHESKISGFVIKNYGPIKYLELQSIPATSQWVFLTGENGVGKSSILKALSSAIGYRKITKRETSNIHNFECEIYTQRDSSVNVSLHRIGNNQIDDRFPLLLGFAAYGPFRLSSVSGRLNERQLKRARSGKGHSLTLFKNNGYLLDLDSQLTDWKKNNFNDDDFERRKYAVKQFLEGILLNVGKVEFSPDRKGNIITLFREKDEEDNLYDPIRITELSSGYVSIMAMMSDLLVRLYRQQPEIDDPGELKGVVFIDEIDIHLHPKFQKHLVEQLTAAFPNIQFIVTTHSPIPLLGAPLNSVFLKITRTLKEGVIITRLKKLESEIQYLLPNTILTSDIFDFDILEDIPKEKIKSVFLEDNYDDVEKNIEIDKRLELLDKSIFPDNLFKDKN